jgi:hypothetical protein
MHRNRLPIRFQLVHPLSKMENDVQKETRVEESLGPNQRFSTRGCGLLYKKQEEASRNHLRRQTPHTES